MADLCYDRFFSWKLGVSTTKTVACVVYFVIVVFVYKLGKELYTKNGKGDRNFEQILRQSWCSSLKSSSVFIILLVQ